MIRFYAPISNCVLFSEVARFHIQKSESGEAEASDASDLPVRVLEY
jgi:hypothetical protein